jgi:hypothetical protein
VDLPLLKSSLNRIVWPVAPGEDQREHLKRQRDCHREGIHGLSFLEKAFVLSGTSGCNAAVITASHSCVKPAASVSSKGAEIPPRQPGGLSEGAGCQVLIESNLTVWPLLHAISSKKDIHKMK